MKINWDNRLKENQWESHVSSSVYQKSNSILQYFDHLLQAEKMFIIGCASYFDLKALVKWVCEWSYKENALFTRYFDI